ncbi:MAG TPA: 30S ribosomal protein S9 [Candidatus Sumerlaeota bacterium]|nr:MAG: 30S ribosomal protein S9 [candidate division BRC1 bacterium ADurb.BinA292]HOE96436.1 30S ribosomal protein S9 [Candidatus Sumerlaeota bacterium]HPK02320.1 30S ribosomal protein S9 [Candidatus Sumerlaeota bacterium]
MEQYLGTGRRKTSVARVYLRPGRGRLIINGLAPEVYFSKRPMVEDVVRAPLRETHTVSKYDVVVNVFGGGVKGQAEAIRHGIARALQNANPAYRPTLKALGFLTRDAREKERKKYGLHKARKATQFSKR